MQLRLGVTMYVSWIVRSATRRRAAIVAIVLAVIGTSPATAQTDGIATAHRFLEQALPRGEASYSGAKITKYSGEGCSSTFAFGNSSFVIDWSQITDVKLFVTVDLGMKVNLTGRFAGNSSIQTRDLIVKSDDLASRVTSAASALRKACDPLKASGF